MFTLTKRRFTSSFDVGRPVVNRWPTPIVSCYSAVTALFIYFLRILFGKRQPYSQVRFHLFDTLACPYLSMHSPAEVTNWFEGNQFRTVTIDAASDNSARDQTMVTDHAY